MNFRQPLPFSFFLMPLTGGMDDCFHDRYNNGCGEKELPVLLSGVIPLSAVIAIN
jgi:hypothetical protein